MDIFEELFKTRAQGNTADLTKIKKVSKKAPSKTSLIEQNKAKNLAITLRKGGMNPSAICTAIETYVLHHVHAVLIHSWAMFLSVSHTNLWKSAFVCSYDQQSLSIEFLELLEHFIPSDFELKLLANYEKDGRPLEELTDEDQFMLRFGKIPRLRQRINTLTFMGNFPDTVKRLQPVGLPRAIVTFDLNWWK